MATPTFTSAKDNGDSVTLPTHAAGDLIFILAVNLNGAADQV